MVTHFTRLFNYDRFANEIILEAILKADNPEKPVQLMAHLLAAQQIWLNRVSGLPLATVELWPALDKQHDNFTEIIIENNKAWTTFLNTRSEIDFENIITYKNFKGEAFNNQLIDIITHVINHGTHHRAQIGQLLKFAGVENLPGTDYILYLRILNS